MFQGFFIIKSRYWLFRSCNQIKIFLIIFISLISCANFVKLFVEVTQLTSFCHNALFHKKRCMNYLISLFHQKLHTIINQCHIENSSPTFQKISSMTWNFLTSLVVVTINHFKNLMMITKSRLLSYLNLWNISPGSD